MCGISAIFKKQSSNAIVHDIANMTTLVRHRGPDDEGYVFFTSHAETIVVAGGNDTPSPVFKSTHKYAPKQSWQNINQLTFNAALGHRRLSILDLSSAGHQPMCSDNEQLWITYNGEVYNYLEIRKQLESIGHQFNTETDTEVILKAYQAWGFESFSHLNGMFAFVIFDCKKRTVIAVRDRFGVKPLYYWISPTGSVAFGSEIKQFTGLTDWDPKINGQRVYDFLNWGVLDHTSETCFKDVMQLRGGEYLSFSLNDLPNIPKPKKWYTLALSKFYGNLQEAGKHFKELLESSVRLRLRADVDIGSCLSGGLDSSSIVCVANHFFRDNKIYGRQKTFSACSDVKQFDERSFIDSVVAATGVDAHYTYPKLENLFNDCQDVIWHQDEPFASTSIYAQWLVFKLSKEKGVKVMLDGQGADEHLAGYHGFFGNRFYDLFCSLRWKTLFDEIQSTKALHNSLSPLSSLLGKFVPGLLVQPLRRIMGRSATKPDWLNLELLQANDCLPNFNGTKKTVVDQSIQQLLHSSLPMLLHWEDRDSMAHSIESRTPFLDYRLVEFTLGLSSDHKISDGWTKRVLRESMKGILPENIRTRIDKLGFVTAEEEWLRRQDPKRFRQALEHSIERSAGLLLPSARKLLDDMIDGKRPFSYLPWRMIILGYWIDRFKLKPLS